MPRDFDPRQAADELMATEEEATLADMLDAVESFVRRYVVLTDHQAAAVVLWIAHVFAFAAVSTTPYLWVSSATPRAGKSRLLEVLEAILGELRSVFTMNISPSALYRMVDATPGVAVLVDESDRLLKGDKERASEILGLINSGFRRRGGYAVRNVGQGANLKPVKFATFAPKVIAGIGAIADTVADRSIPIRMRRRLPSESIERFRERDVAGAAPLREALEAWVDPDTISALSVARPDLPLALNDRAADAWEVLVAIADAAGGAWPARARSAAVDLQGVTESISEEVLELLALRHVAEAFEVASADRLATAAILASLVDRDDGPWAEWWGQDVSDGRTKGPARRLAKLLHPFGIEPGTIRIGGETPRGYERADLADAVARHVTARPGGNETNATDTTPLASHVASVASVALPDGREARNGRGTLAEQDALIAGWNAAVEAGPPDPYGGERHAS